MRAKHLYEKECEECGVLFGQHTKECPYTISKGGQRYHPVEDGRSRCPCCNDDDPQGESCVVVEGHYHVGYRIVIPSVDEDTDHDRQAGEELDAPGTEEQGP